MDIFSLAAKGVFFHLSELFEKYIAFLQLPDSFTSGLIKKSVGLIRKGVKQTERLMNLV